MTSNNNKIYFAGPSRHVCSSIIRTLQRNRETNFVICTHAELELTNQPAVQSFFKKEKRMNAYVTVAKVGGIHAKNTYPAELVYQNLMLQANLIDAASTTKTTSSSKL